MQNSLNIRRFIRAVLAEAQTSDDLDADDELVKFASAPVDTQDYLRQLLELDQPFDAAKSFKVLFSEILRSTRGNPEDFARECLEAVQILSSYGYTTLFLQECMQDAIQHALSDHYNRTNSYAFLMRFAAYVKKNIDKYIPKKFKRDVFIRGIKLDQI